MCRVQYTLIWLCTLSSVLIHVPDHTYGRGRAHHRRGTLQVLYRVYASNHVVNYSPVLSTVYGIAVRPSILALRCPSNADSYFLERHHVTQHWVFTIPPSVPWAQLECRRRPTSSTEVPVSFPQRATVTAYNFNDRVIFCSTTGSTHAAA